MNKLRLTAAILVIAAVSSQGALIIDVNGAANTTDNNNDQGSASKGTLTATKLIVDGDDQAGTSQQFTITDLTLDGTGSDDDSIVVNLLVSGFGGTLQTSGSAAAGWISAGDNDLNATGEYVQWSFVSFDVLLDGVSDAGATAATSFLGFDGVKMGSWDSLDSGIINGTTVTHSGVDNEVFSTALNATLKTEWAAGAWRPLGMDFQIDTIPEPATLGVVSLFGGGILFIRRKLAM